jgi:membrane protein DedA with SNARE-associated domain
VPHDVADFIARHGYLAIFLLVFSQEIGIPNPVPNELTILFSGYLSYLGVLSLPLVFLCAASADFLGTALLFLAFHYFGARLLPRAPPWVPVRRIERLKERLSGRGDWALFVGRLISYLRGYVSVAAGLIGVPPRVFLATVVWSSVVWAGAWAAAGHLLGPGWEALVTEFHFSKVSLIIAAATAAGLAAVVYLPRLRRRSRSG